MVKWLGSSVRKYKAAAQLSAGCIYSPRYLDFFLLLSRHTSPLKMIFRQLGQTSVLLVVEYFRPVHLLGRQVAYTILAGITKWNI